MWFLWFGYKFLHVSRLLKMKIISFTNMSGACDFQIHLTGCSHYACCNFTSFGLSIRLSCGSYRKTEIDRRCMALVTVTDIGVARSFFGGALFPKKS